jgi:hypothetical protein
MAKNQFKDLDEDVVVCNKTCLKKYLSNKKDKALSRDNDGELGVDNPNNSVAILIGWLTTQGNYSKIYHSKHNGGKTKTRVCEIIVEYINSYNVKIKRDSKMVLNKIQH